MKTMLNTTTTMANANKKKKKKTKTSRRLLISWWWCFLSFMLLFYNLLLFFSPFLHFLISEYYVWIIFHFPLSIILFFLRLPPFLHFCIFHDFYIYQIKPCRHKYTNLCSSRRISCTFYIKKTLDERIHNKNVISFYVLILLYINMRTSVFAFLFSFTLRLYFALFCNEQ